MFTRLAPIVITVLICVALTLGLATAHWAAVSQPRSRVEIAKEQLKLAQLANKIARENLQRPPRPGEGGLISPGTIQEMMVWARREVEASGQLGTKQQRLAAMRNFKEEMRAFAVTAEKLWEASPLDYLAVLDVKYQVLQAELWIIEAEAEK